MTFARPIASTTARGYGNSHNQARAALLAAHYDGAPCCLCGHPMVGPTRNLDADHLPNTTTYRGLAHGAARCQVCSKRCNRSDGGSRGALITNARRKAARKGQDTRTTSPGL